MNIEIDVSTLIGNLKLPSPIYNASGVWCTSYSEIDAILNHPESGAVVTKSCTLDSRDGNPTPRYFDNISYIDSGSINSMGLPNNGVNYYLDVSHRIENVIHKPFFLSVCGLSVNENLEILQRVIDDDNSRFSINGIELNLSCPNIPGKPQLAYDFEAFDNTLRKIFEMNELKNYQIGLKLPPYFDFAHFDQARDIINEFSDKVSFVTCCNSLGNGLVVDVNKEMTTIAPKNGYGGIGGDFIKPIALSNVRYFSQSLDGGVDVIGCGGVKSGTDVFEHVLCGASAVQIGTSLMKNGPMIFECVMNELKTLMKHKGYASLSEFRGKLKILQ